jgi:hypothetical protein|nr:MAG TPA_asm: hypothetical protein [Caudoviricetes sp.]
MKIIDEHGSPIENPDLTLGYLKDDSEIIHHEAVEAVEQVTHYEYKTYPNGGRDRITVVDVPGVAAKEAYDEKVEVHRYILYTDDELAAQEKARKEAEEKAQLPTAEERLAALEAAMLDLLAAQ